MLAYALHWYNPVVWAMGRSLCFYQEASCDSHVTARADEEAVSYTHLDVYKRQVLHQPFEDIEVLAVDDGSTDQSL